MSDSDLQGWVGRQEVVTDRIGATPSRALAATLSRGDAALRPGEPLPGLWHWIHFLPLVPTSALGPDGHPRRDPARARRRRRRDRQAARRSDGGGAPDS